jgi:hypothetical protein
MPAMVFSLQMTTARLFINFLLNVVLRIQIVYFDFSIFGLYNCLVDNDGLIHIRFHGLTSSC